MNYRHAYHAGNFADVVKHTVLALVIEHLKRKEAPFRVIDTHAGSGLYALDSEHAGKTREWEAGIGRLLGPAVGSGTPALPARVAALMAPYLDAVRQENGGAGLRLYPGSPQIARRLLRPQDSLILNELHPEEHAQLKATVGRDPRVKVLALDGWLGLKAQLPPKERRGIILIDPPFEQDGELQRMAEGLEAGMRRFAGGVYLAWYPVKDPKPVAKLHSAVAAFAGDKALRIELMLRRPTDRERLNGCGLLVLNAPHTLSGDMAIVLPELTRRLSDGSGSSGYVGPLLGRPSTPPREADRGADRGAGHRSDTPYRRKRSSA